MRLVLLLALLAAPALAEPPSPRLPREGQRLPPERRRALEEEVRGKMQAYLAVELSSRLGLDEQRAQQLSAALARQGERRQAARQRTRAAHQRLEALLEQKADAAALERQMQEVSAARAEEAASLGALLEEIKAFLTVREQARLVVALPEVMREMRQMMRQSRRGHRQGERPSSSPPAR